MFISGSKFNRSWLVSKTGMEKVIFLVTERLSTFWTPCKYTMYAIPLIANDNSTNISHKLLCKRFDNQPIRLSSDVTGQLSVASWFGHLHLRGDGLNSGLFRPWNFPMLCHSGAVSAKKCIKCIVLNVIVSSRKVSTPCCDSNSTGTLLLAQCRLLQQP